MFSAVRDVTRRSSYEGLNRPDPSVFYQKSYPGSVGVTVGNLYTRNKRRKVSGNGRQEKAYLGTRISR